MRGDALCAPIRGEEMQTFADLFQEAGLKSKNRWIKEMGKMEEEE